jgi:hypothetical protein
MRTIEDVLNRIRGEFAEMPGLRLKSEQLQRLCGVERTICQLVLDSLVDMNFLCVKSDGSYARLTDGAIFPSPWSEGGPQSRHVCQSVVTCWNTVSSRVAECSG